MKKIKEKLFMATVSAGAGITAMTAAASPAYADALSNAARDAAKGIQASAEGIIKWVLVVALIIMGFAFMGVGGQRAKENQKDTAWEKIVGAILVASAIPIATLIFKWL